MKLELPLRLHSAANLREHWAVRAKRVAYHRRLVALKLGRHLRRFRSEGELHVTLTRVAPRALDDDNLASAFKAVRDQVAAELGRNDGQKSGLSWAYRQEPGPYAIRVELTWLNVYERILADEGLQGPRL